MKESLSCLVVDDQLNFSSTFSEILKFEGFDAEYTTSAKEALKMISTNNYDLIFLDVNMPELSGIEMLKKIPKISKNQPKCIMVTGYSESEIIISALNAGAVGYLVKPIDMEKLNKILKTIQDEAQKKPTNIDSPDFSSLTTVEKKVFDQISKNSFSRFGLEFTDVDPYFLGLRTGARDWLKVMNILNKLSEKGFIKREESKRVILCPSCESVETYSRYLCTSCESTKIHRLNLIQHIKCGHMEHNVDQLGEPDYLCPKCLPKTHNQEKYKIIGAIFECSECGTRFNKPNISHYCKNCEEYFDYHDSRYIQIYDYILNNSIKGKIGESEPIIENRENIIYSDKVR